VTPARPPKTIIAPSLLSADFAQLTTDLRRCEDGGADWLHVDVMDGCFVPNLTFGAKVMETVHRVTKLPLDVHMMVVQPEKYFDDFARAGAATLTIHAEAAPHLQRQLARIRELGCKAGVALNPGTPLSAVEDVLDDLDLLLVMTVNPGFGGQKFLHSQLDKIRRLRRMIGDRPIQIEVDGGVTPETAPLVIEAGATALVAGSAVFGRPPYAKAIAALRG
jgi:ribulose-phosphate 3-epimerase